MKTTLTSALFALGIAGASQAAAVIATTDFEDAAFSGGVTGGIAVTDASGDYWEVGGTDGNYAGVWGTQHTAGGSRGAVFGNFGVTDPHFLANPAGAEGVSIFSFWIVKTGSVTDAGNDPLIDVEWSTDGASWTPVATDVRIENILGSGNPGWEQHTYNVNQAGDVQVRVNVTGVFDGSGSSHVSLDDVEITAIPEPSSTALLGLGGLGLILRRRK